MTEVLVSVRMPRRLAKEMRRVSLEMSYLDLSEAVRSMVRERWQREQHPLTYEIERIKEELRLLRRAKPAARQRMPADAGTAAGAGASAGAAGGGGR